MKDQNQTLAPSVQSQVIDSLRAALFASMARYFTDVVGTSPLLPQMNRNVLKQTSSQLERLEREVRRTTKGLIEPNYMDRNLRESKLLDISTVVDLMARIGIEEHGDIYEEFMGLVVDLMDGILYAQKKRRKLHFGKYKALFRLIAEECRRDVNGEPGQVLYTNKGELFLRTAPPQNPTEVK